MSEKKSGTNLNSHGCTNIIKHIKITSD